MNHIVIDKSYLQSIKSIELVEVAKDNKLLLTTALAFELFTEKKRTQKENCYKKLSAIQNSVVYVGTVIDLINYECENQLPCTPIEKQFLPEKFGPKLFDPDFILGEPQKRMINFFQREWESNEVKVFKILGSKASRALPKLQTLKAGSNRNEVQSVLEALANKPEVVKEIYEQVSLEFKPSTDRIDTNWAFFRKTQMYLAYGVEYTRKFGAGNIEFIAKRFEHDVIDMEYLIFSVLTGAFATNDHDLKRFFSLFCPNGKLFQIVVA